MTAFEQWVVNTIVELGGNPSEYLCGSWRKWALTSTETRMDACQGGFEDYLQPNNPALARCFVIVPTNLEHFH